MCTLLVSCCCLQKYENNLKKGTLTDNTIMLWNDRYAEWCVQEKSAFEDNIPLQFTSAHTASAQGPMGSCTFY
jgi:hypothetical protein